MDDWSYTLRLKQTLTIKPDGFVIHAIPRANVSPLLPSMGNSQSHDVKTKTQSPSAAAAATTTDQGGEKKRLNVLYGSNTGSSEAFAQRIASTASSKGKSACIRMLCICLSCLRGHSLIYHTRIYR
jgi:cytochrome P450/NADPH-cytochrome P450 reductase